MTELPSELSYGHVVGRFLFAEGDGPDDGRLPDGAAASGTVKFTPLATIRRTTADPVTVLKKPVVCTLDSSGYLTDSQGARGVWLVAAQYKVDFTIDGVVVPSFNIVVDSADTEVDPLDLTLEAELTPEPSTKFVVNEQVYLDTLAARDDVLAAIPPGGTTGQVLAKASDADLDTTWTTGGAGGGVTDHGALTGLVDDDHPQYHTDARGDLRYSPLGHGHSTSEVAGLDSALAGKSDTGHGHAIIDVTGLDTALAGKAEASGQYAVNTASISGAATVPATHAAHALTMTADTALTFDNPTAGHAFLLYLSGAFVPTLPGSIIWAGGAAPEYASAGTLYHFTTLDGGTTWLGSGQAYS